MMAGSDLMFPGYNAETLSQLKTSKETKIWRRNKPRFWPGVSSEELFVASLLRRSLVLKDLGKVPGIVDNGWATDWERWVSAEGCKLGNVVKLDGPADAQTYGPAALDVKIYPDGANASKGRFNAYFARNFSDAELRADDETCQEREPDVRPDVNTSSATACSSASTPVLASFRATPCARADVNPRRAQGAMLTYVSSSTPSMSGRAFKLDGAHRQRPRMLTSMLCTYAPPTLLLLPDEPQLVQPAPSFLLHFPN